MTKTLGRCLALVAALAASASAQEAGLPLESSFGALKVGLSSFRPHPLMTPGQQEGDSEAARILFRAQSGLPAPDAATLQWLSSRIPGLDAKSVKQIDWDIAEQVMIKASTAKATWLDVLADPVFRGGSSYYVPQDVLNKIDAKYVTGLVHVQGRAENGQAYQMQGFVGGQGKVHLLFSLTDFSYKDDEGKRFKIDNGGRLSVSIRGNSDINVEGFSAYGAPIFCPWARINRMTKTGPYKVRVETSCATRDADLKPVRAR